MHFFYIIYSQDTDKFYIGETHDIISRLEKHNSHSYQKSFTKISEDWKIVLEFQCLDRENALYLEKFVKRMKSRKFIEKIIADNRILTEILENRK